MTDKPLRVTVLGSTGSIGTNTLDVMARHPERFEVFALTGASQVDVMLRQCAQFKPRFAVMVSADAAQQLKEKIQAAFKRSAETEGRKISVSVDGNKVTLSGKVHSLHEKAEAGLSAWNAPGVMMVENNIQISQ